MTKRNDILSTALRLFNEHGYHAVGVDRIRDEAQVSKMTLYNHFSNKEKLVEEVLKLRHDVFKRSLNASIANFEHPLDKLREVFNWHARWFFSRDFHGCMFIKATGEFHDTPGFIAISQNHKAWVAKTLAGIFSEIGTPTPDLTANMYQVVLDGMIVNASIFNSFDQINDVWTVLCKHHGFPLEALDRPNENFSFSVGGTF